MFEQNYYMLPSLDPKGHVRLTLHKWSFSACDVCFSHDDLSPWNTVLHLAQMRSLQTSDPETRMALQNCDYVVKTSGIPFTNMIDGQTFERKQIREIKATGGITRIAK